MPFNTPTDSYKLRVEVEGLNEVEGFSKCSPIKPKVEGGARGRAVWEDIILERVYSGRDEMRRWWDQITAGNTDRRTVTITFLAADGVEVLRRYDLLSAYPTAWELPPLDATASGPATEKVTLGYERVISTP